MADTRTQTQDFEMLFFVPQMCVCTVYIGKCLKYIILACLASIITFNVHSFYLGKRNRKSCIFHFRLAFSLDSRRALSGTRLLFALAFFSSNTAFFLSVRRSCEKLCVCIFCSVHSLQFH